jgi:hypothetical protein
MQGHSPRTLQPQLTDQNSQDEKGSSLVALLQLSHIRKYPHLMPSYNRDKGKRSFYTSLERQVSVSEHYINSQSPKHQNI